MPATALDPERSPPRPTLPTLTSTPTIHPSSCLSLSAPLLTHLTFLLPAAPALTLSIGSGYGLLEALLLSPPYALNIVGVEVQPSPNKHLPQSNHREVPGSRFLDPLAAQAEGWVFVYPRRVGLVEEYIREFGGGGKVRVVVWVGPTADWVDYKDVFGDGVWDVEARGADEVGGRAWEVVAVAKRKVTLGVQSAG